jgi:hypothetical protein
MRHRLAGGIEHPQVGEVGAHDALVHRLRQLDLKQRLRAVDLDRDAEGEIAGRLGNGQQRPAQPQQPGANPLMAPVLLPSAAPAPGSRSPASTRRRQGRTRCARRCRVRQVDQEQLADHHRHQPGAKPAIAAPGTPGGDDHRARASSVQNSDSEACTSSERTIRSGMQRHSGPVVQRAQQGRVGPDEAAAPATLQASDSGTAASGGSRDGGLRRTRWRPPARRPPAPDRAD